MSRRLTLSQSDLEIIKLLLTRQINSADPSNKSNFIIGVMRLKELLAKINP